MGEENILVDQEDFHGFIAYLQNNGSLGEVRLVAQTNFVVECV